MGNTTTRAATQNMYDMRTKGKKIEFNFFTTSGVIFFSFYDRFVYNSNQVPIYYYDKMPCYIKLYQDKWEIVTKSNESIVSTDIYDSSVGHKLTIYADTKNISYYIDDNYFYTHPYDNTINYGFLFEFYGLPTTVLGKPSTTKYNTNITNFKGEEYVERTIQVQQLINLIANQL